MRSTRGPSLRMWQPVRTCCCMCCCPMPGPVRAPRDEYRRHRHRQPPPHRQSAHAPSTPTRHPPLPHPPAPASPPQARAPFFNSGTAFDIKLPEVPARLFAPPQEGRYGVFDCDQSRVLGCGFAASTPLLLARYLRIAARAALPPLDVRATGSVWYVISGSGSLAGAVDGFAFAAGDVFLLPGACGYRLEAGAAGALLWGGGNEPQPGFEHAQPAPRAGGAHGRRALSGRGDRAPVRADLLERHAQPDLGPSVDLLVRPASRSAQPHAHADIELQHPGAEHAPAHAPPQLGRRDAGGAGRRLPFAGRPDALPVGALGDARDAAGRAALAPQRGSTRRALPDRAGRRAALPHADDGVRVSGGGRLTCGRWAVGAVVGEDAERSLESLRLRLR